MSDPAKRGYSLLPNFYSNGRFTLQDRISKRYYKFFFVFVAILGLFEATQLWHRHYYGVYGEPAGELLPPLFPQYHKSELELPQHNPDLPYPEGRTGKYLWMAEHTHDAGWGNILQEHFLNGLLAYHSGRSFVFDNYTWSRNMPYSEYNGHLIPSQIPMTALISGPLAGGAFAPGDNTPRPVHKEYYEQVCPDAKVLDKEAVRATLPGDYSAATVLQAWVKLANETPDRCVVIDENVFDIWIFGSERLLDSVPMLYDSPIVNLFRWSPLVIRAFTRNSALFAPHGFPPSTSDDPYTPIPGLLALHIRRGDFEGHCQHLARWRSSWTGFNMIPTLIDKYVKPPVDENDLIYEEGREYYRKVCYPSIEHIVEKVVEIKKTNAGKDLSTIFLMTNGKPDWIAEVKEALHAAGTWESIQSSRDLALDWEQKHVAGAIDMLIGQRADVFVGNGFSSLTGNIVMLRMQKLDPWRTRLW